MWAGKQTVVRGYPITLLQPASVSFGVVATALARTRSEPALSTYLRQVDRLAGGLYYDAAGSPTAALAAVETSAAKAQGEAAARNAEQKRIPNCSSKWSLEDGGTVYCTAGYPRKVRL